MENDIHEQKSHTYYAYIPRLMASTRAILVHTPPLDHLILGFFSFAIPYIVPFNCFLIYLFISAWVRYGVD